MIKLASEDLPEAASLALGFEKRNSNFKAIGEFVAHNKAAV